MDKLKDYGIIIKMGGDLKAITLWRRCMQQVDEFGDVITKENRTWVNMPHTFLQSKRVSYTTM